MVSKITAIRRIISSEKGRKIVVVADINYRVTKCHDCWNKLSKGDLENGQGRDQREKQKRRRATIHVFALVCVNGEDYMYLGLYIYIDKEVWSLVYFNVVSTLKSELYLSLIQYFSNHF